MRQPLLLIAVLVLLVASTSCRNSSSQTSSEPVQADAVPLRIGQDQEGQVPSFLWSPSRRKASAGYFYLVAEYKALGGDLHGAQNLFESSYNLDPNPFVAAKLISVEAMSGKADQSLTEAKKMVLLYPKSSPLRFLYGKLLAQRGVYKEAVEELEYALTLDADNEAYYAELIDLHQAARDISKAIAVAKELTGRIPHSVIGWSRLARLYLINGQKKAALEPALRAYEMQAANPENTLIYALALEANNQSKKAVALYEALYRINPNNEELIERMIELYRSIGNLNESLELLNELADLPGGARPGVQLQRAIILWELKKFEPAAQILEEIASQLPDQYRLSYLAGVGQEKLKNHEKALVWFEKIPESSEFWMDARIRVAAINKESKNYDAALAELLALEKKEKADPDIYSLTASVYAEKKDFGSAIEFLDKGYARFKDEHRLLFMKGVYEEKNNDIEACIVSMRKVIEVDPQNSAALNYLGYIFAERGENLDEAERLIKRALEIKPNDGYYLDSLAWVYYQRKSYEKALKLLLQSLTIVADEGVVLEHLADVYLKLGKKDKALEFYEKALSKPLEEKEKIRIEEKFKKLKSAS